MKEITYPLITVIMVSYNHEQYIKEAINSIFKQKECYPEIELLIIDDGSTDKTYEILENLKMNAPLSMNLIRKQHEGIQALPKNLNQLIESARGKYIAMLASDDEFVPNRFAKQIKILENDKSIQFVYGNGLNIELNNSTYVNSKKVVKMAQDSDTHEIYDYITTYTSPFYLQSIIVRKNFLSTYTPFDETIIADDWVFNIRAFDNLIKKNLSFAYINDVLFLRHIHTSNTSKNVKTHYLRIQQVIQKYIPPKNKKRTYKWFYFTFAKANLKELNLLTSFYLFCKFISNELNLYKQIYNNIKEQDI